MANSSQKNNSSNDGFIFDDHIIVYDLQNLIKKIKTLNENSLKNYVNERKNDFSHWIKDSLGDTELAIKLEEETTKKDLLRILESHKDLNTSIKKNIPLDNECVHISKKSPYSPKAEKPMIKASNPKQKIITQEEEILNEEDAEKSSQLLNDTIDEIIKVFIGQDEVVKKVLLCIICDAHALLEGVPGLAKTLLVETLAKVISGTTFSRIQFLPDLLPSDIIGGQIYNPKTSTFTTFKGPIFANFVLADEINRAPPKTHAALMEAMQEKKINIDKETFILDRPFLVLATQNPLENKGTYQLPEAVLDRFMSKIMLDYPKRSDEKIIITENATTRLNIQKNLKIIMSKQNLLNIQKLVRKVFISDRIKEYILDLVEATRGLNKNIEGFKFVKYGGGVRASIYLGIAAKAKALFEGRNYVLPEDIMYVAPEILRHRICLNYNGKAHNISADKIVEEILNNVHPI